MKKIIAMLILLTLTVSAQVSSKTPSDLTTHGSGTNPTSWVQEFVFVDALATRAGPFTAAEPLVGIAITRDIVYDSTLAGGHYLADGYHYDSTWTASDFAFLYGFKRTMNDSARTTLTATDTLDFLPVYDNDGNRVIVQADSMSYIDIPPLEHVGMKYFYVEFIDTTASPDTLVTQKEPRTMIFFYGNK